MKKLLIAVLFVLSFAAGAGQASANPGLDPGSGLDPSGVTWESVGVTWE